MQLGHILCVTGRVKIGLVGDWQDYVRHKLTAMLFQRGYLFVQCCHATSFITKVAVLRIWAHCS